MKIRVAWIKSGGTRSAAIEDLAAQYVKRISAFAQIETQEFKSEAALLKPLERSSAKLIVLDSRGRDFSSEQFAEWLRAQRDASIDLIFAVGPADGFSDEARQAAFAQISLGKMTLPHELARVVLLEQIYRAFTILARHPYHLGQ
jgi:23S rRNA (pseudouridine1915-N3)-methyltransferase